VFIVVYIFFHQAFEGKKIIYLFSISFFLNQSLRPIDRDFLHHLQHKVNIIPVIAKADTLLKSELTALKKQLLSDIDKHGVQLYDFPEGDSEQDEDTQSLDKVLRVNKLKKKYSN
jgi:septin family protein